MGFEIQFKYYKKKSEGFGYDTEGEPEVMKVPVGKQWDDVDLDEVAKAVFGQMAKRNILIVDADIYEYTKKKVSFKLKDDGISIKNRKFSYDITGTIRSESENEGVVAVQPIVQGGQVNHPHQMMQQQPQQMVQEQALVVQQPQEPDYSHLPSEVQAEIVAMKKAQAAAPVNPNQRLRPVLPPSGTPLRYEIYDPHPDLKRMAEQKKLPFTIGKKYPIFEEKADKRGLLFGMVYLTEDDHGNRRALNDKHFVPMQSLSHASPETEARPNHQARLAYDDNVVQMGNQTMVLPDIFTLGKRR